MTTIANAEVKLDQWGMGAWIALMVLGFILWWPVGLAILAYHRMERTHELLETRLRWHGRYGRGAMRDRGWTGVRPSSGNHAFDEYRTETLRRLEDEQREFKEFLERLRFAKRQDRVRPVHGRAEEPVRVRTRRHRRNPDRPILIGESPRNRSAQFAPPMSLRRRRRFLCASARDRRVAGRQRHAFERCTAD